MAVSFRKTKSVVAYLSFHPYQKYNTPILSMADVKTSYNPRLNSENKPSVMILLNNGVKFCKRKYSPNTSRILTTIIQKEVKPGYNQTK